MIPDNNQPCFDPTKCDIVRDLKVGDTLDAVSPTDLPSKTTVVPKTGEILQHNIKGSLP